MKKVVMMVLVIGMMVLTGCGSSITGVSETLDGTWETKVWEERDEAPVMITIDGGRGVYEEPEWGIVCNCEIDRSEGVIVMVNEYGNREKYSYEIIKDKLVLTPENGLNDIISFHKVKEEEQKK